MSIYDDWGLTPIINASGAVTRLGGAPMPAAVLQAYHEAAACAVPLDEVQGVASRYLAEVTGAEAGLVTCGASAALMLGAAAILARHSPARMEQLPRTEGMPNRFVIAREHRNGYDHAVRAAGVCFVDVGYHEPIAGAGVRRCEAWEYDAAIDESTAGVLYVWTEDSQPPLAEVVQVAHRRGVPVLVDAAGGLPPRSNLRDLIACGADLVCFSGGKAIRGPQGTGILCGRRELVSSAAVQMLDLDDHPALWEPLPDLIVREKLHGMPRHGIGRSVKVSKEEILSLLTAVKLFIRGDYDAELPRMEARLRQIADGLNDGQLPTELIPVRGDHYPQLTIDVSRAPLGHSAWSVARMLRHGSPRIYVGHGLLTTGKLVIHPLHLRDEDVAVIVREITRATGR